VLRSVYSWVFCVILLIVLSLATAPPPPQKVTDDVTVNWRTLASFGNLGRPWYRNLGLWWIIFAIGIIGCYFTFSGLVIR